MNTAYTSMYAQVYKQWLIPIKPTKPRELIRKIPFFTHELFTRRSQWGKEWTGEINQDIRLSLPLGGFLVHTQNNRASFKRKPSLQNGGKNKENEIRYFSYQINFTLPTIEYTCTQNNQNTRAKYFCKKQKSKGHFYSKKYQVKSESTSLTRKN